MLYRGVHKDIICSPGFKRPIRGINSLSVRTRFTPSGGCSPKNHKSGENGHSVSPGAGLIQLMKNDPIP